MAAKKKIIKSLESLDDELLALISRQYPQGYEASLTRISTPKKETIFVFPLETEEATILVKVPATRNSEGDYDLHPQKKSTDEFAIPRQSDELEEESDDVEQDEDDYDDDDSGGRGRKDPSYDPDFDA